jgi:hypothetical protein
MSSKQFLAWSLLIMILFFTYAYTEALAHEKAHSVICENYFGDALTQVWFAPDIQVVHGITYCYNITQSHFDSYTESQSMVEAFGYQINTAMEAIIAFFWAIGTLYILKRDYDESA